MIPPGKERPQTMPTSGQPRLLVEERRRKILDLVEKQTRATVGELVQRSGDDLLEAKNFGMTSLTEVREKLVQLGLSLRGE